MKLAGVLKKERELKGISIAETALKLNISEDDYRHLEEGHSSAEKWAGLLVRTALKLESPTSRLISENGRAVGIKKGSCGELIRRCRENKQTPLEEMARAVGMSKAEYEEIERGESPLEVWGPQLLCFAELIEQPIYNLICPCGVPLEKMEDYP
jgi:transcriptional regulator with XRE-family HTH domain